LILDSSALVAVLLREPQFERLLIQIAQPVPVGVGAPTLTETAIVLSSRLGSGAVSLLARFVDEARIVVVPFGAHHWDVAVGAFQRFGKGRHPAALNFGDCLTYAVARVTGEPLLCLGDDFARTDISMVTF